MPKHMVLLVRLVLVCFLLSLTGISSFGQQPAGQDRPVEEIEIRGNRRIPKESILYYIQTKVGDRFNPELARRDLEAIVTQGWFDPLQTKILTDDGPRGGVVLIFQVREYPIIRALEYHGLKSATETEILTKFKERHTQVSKESQLDPAKANAAKNVLRDLLAEKGRPEAKVEVEVEEISATAVALIFDIEEGPRVRVKDIVFEVDRDLFSQKRLRGAMKLVKEAGLISTFSSKDVYFADKLEYDLEQVRFFLGTKGYLQCKIGDPKVEPAGKVSGGIPIPIPGLHKEGPGLRITVPVEVGRRYKITKVEEKGVTQFQPGVVTAVSGMVVGDWVNAKHIQDGVYKNVKDLYGERGYIQASAYFLPNFIDRTNEEGDVEVTLEIDEGKQFTLRRLEFIGNTNTRDKVMRREVVINEGDPYSKRYWDLSILRLNQLGLFEEIKEKDAITRTNERTQEVEIDLQVKEKGRQQIQLNGGVSGYAGSFFGLEYSTNNLLGYGESLSVAFQGGNRQLYLMFGFTEPYFLEKPMSLGFQIYGQKYQFFGSGNYYATPESQQIISQANLFGLSSVDAASLFTQYTFGGTVTLSSPMAIFTRKWPNFTRLARLGFSYSLTNTRINDPEINNDPDPTKHIQVTYSQPNILTSRVTPSLFYNTLNASIDPTSGKSLFAGLALSGGFLGGDVNTIQPSVEFKMFNKIARKRSEKPQVLGMRFLAGHIRSFGTPIDTSSLSFVDGVPIYERYFLGGEDTIRGYNIRSISPVVASDSYLSTQNVTPKVLDSTGALVAAPPGTVHQSAIRQYTFDAPGGSCGFTSSANCNVQLGLSSLAYIGGDTQLLYNVEYRIPIFGPLSVAAFGDIGTSFNLKNYKGQVVTTNYTEQLLTPNGVLTNPAGRIATSEEVQGAAADLAGSPIGYRQVFMSGQSRRYDVIRPPSEVLNFLNEIRSSVGAEIRVQMPVINVPFRLIFAYNPNAKTDTNQPNVYFYERTTVVRFSIGRTF
jgi:outer membrane protein insertion porin family